MLGQRVITATFIAIVFLAALFASSPIYLGLLSLFILASASWEWSRMAQLRSVAVIVCYVALPVLMFLPFLCMAVGESVADTQTLDRIILGLTTLVGAFWLFAASAVLNYPNAPASWLSKTSIALSGILVLLAAVVSLLTLRSHDSGVIWILYCVVIVAAADIGAYFSGRRWGKRKLAVNVSPGKSWEGFWGGLLCAQLVAVGFIYFWGHELLPEMQSANVAWFMLVTLLLSTASVFGDLFESLLKRRVGLKDSSQLLPGHGGVLDRIDGLIAALPVLLICQRSLGW